MRIATAPINWNNEDVPNRAGWVPYPRILDEVRAAGYTATEWSNSLPEDPARLAPDLAARGLALLGAYEGLALRDAARVEGEIERAVAKARFLRELGAEHLIAADSGDAARQAAAGHVEPELGLDDAGWASLCAGLDELGRQLRPLGMRLVFHNHVGTYVETAGETARLLDGTDPGLVGWCLDCGHLAYGGGDTLQMLARYGDRVAYVHLKDVDGAVLERARAEGWSFQQALAQFVFAPIGRGIARVPEVVSALARAGYDGPLVVEQDTTPRDPTLTARENREALEGILRGLGAAR